MKGGCGCNKDSPTVPFMKGGSFFSTSSFHDFDSGNKYHYPVNRHDAGDPLAPSSIVSSRLIQGGTRRKKKMRGSKKRKSCKNTRKSRRGGSIFYKSVPISNSPFPQIV